MKLINFIGYMLLGSGAMVLAALIGMVEVFKPIK